MITNTFKVFLSLLLLTNFSCFATEKDNFVTLSINNQSYTLKESVLERIPALNAIYKISKTDNAEEGNFSLSCNNLADVIELLKLTTTTELTDKVQTLFTSSNSLEDRIYQFKNFINQIYNLQINIKIIESVMNYLITLILTRLNYSEGKKICSQSFRYKELNELFKELLAFNYKHAPIVMEQVASYDSQRIQVNDSQNTELEHIVMIETHRITTRLEYNFKKTIASSCSITEIYTAIYAQKNASLPDITDIHFREEQIKIYPHIQVTKQDDNSLIAYYHDEAPIGIIDSMILNYGFY